MKEKSENPVVKKILSFVGQETGGTIAFIDQKGDDQWTLEYPMDGGILIGPFKGGTEEEVVVKYWQDWFRRVEASLNRNSSLRRRIFRSDLYQRAKKRHERWSSWRDQNIPKGYFAH